MSPFAFQLFALTLLLLSGGHAAGQQDTSIVRIDTLKPNVGSAFTVEKIDGRVDPRFRRLIKRLADDGWPEQWVVARFTDKRTVYIPKMAVVKPRKEGASITSDHSAYAWVNTEESALACKTFIAKYEPIMAEAEKRYGVDKETIAALMRCETRHGTVTGDYHVFSVYASMALMGEPSVVDTMVSRAKQQLTVEKASAKWIASEAERIRNRADNRSSWAYKELVNMLKIDRSGSADALSIYGSWAGAFGWSQFLPSSYLRSAVDGNGDHKIDLFNPADAIHSVANYLSKAGFKIDNAASQAKAIRSYNNSGPYVESIMALAARVRKHD
ncbi:MAG: lytic murein transglycosylase [Candidatus Kapaibacterium sp.]